MKTLLIAPYVQAKSGAGMALGAAAKIEAVIKILEGISSELLIVNSAHNETTYRETKLTDLKIGDAIYASVIPFTLKNRTLGKFANALFPGGVIKHALQFQPDLIWIYNAYIFESRVALALKKMLPNCKMVVELEDWPLSRSRGFNPKPYLDYWGLSRAVRQASLVTCVNSTFAGRRELARKSTMLLPSILSPLISNIAAPYTPFSRPDSQIIAGYFGGLSEEKGVDSLIRLIESDIVGVKFIITGSGPLAGTLTKLSEKFPQRLEFHGVVPQAEMYRLMYRCDALVNPHKSIAHMHDGVFPFKIFEMLATGRLLITTPLPNAGVTLQGSVIFFDGTDSSLQRSLTDARDFYHAHAAAIVSTSVEVLSQYSIDAVRTKITKDLED